MKKPLVCSWVCKEKIWSLVSNNKKRRKKHCQQHQHCSLICFPVFHSHSSKKCHVFVQSLYFIYILMSILLYVYPARNLRFPHQSCCPTAALHYCDFPSQWCHTRRIIQEACPAEIPSQTQEELQICWEGELGREEEFQHAAELWEMHRINLQAVEEGEVDRIRPQQALEQEAAVEAVWKSPRLTELQRKGWPTAGKKALRWTQVTWTPPLGPFLLTWPGSRMKGTTSSNTASLGMP